MEPLPLFSNEQSNPNILNIPQITPISQKIIPKPVDHIRSKEDSILALLNQLFPEQNKDEKVVRQTKEILGQLAMSLNIDEIHTIINEVQFLVETWLDDFERAHFNGITLNELLNKG